MAERVDPAGPRARDLKRFVKVPFRLHRDSPQWVPPLIFERMEFLDRQKNPYFEHAEAEYFLAERDGEAVGRITRPGRPRAGTSTRAAATRCSASSRRPTTPRSPAALLDAATGWLREQGPRRACSGPMDFTTNDEIGILIEGYELRPMILEPWHPPYYRELIEAEGFGKAMDVLMWELAVRRPQGGRALRSLDPRRRREGAARQGIVIRNMRKRDMAAEVRRFMRGLQRGLGRQLGLRPDHRRRGRVPGQEPQAGDRRGLGLHGREGRRGRRRGADPARHQPGDGEAERPAAALRLAAGSCSASARSTSCGSSRSASSTSTTTPASPPASTSSTSRPPPDRARSAAARWAGSSRPTSR